MNGEERTMNEGASDVHVRSTRETSPGEARLDESRMTASYMGEAQAT